MKTVQRMNWFYLCILLHEYWIYSFCACRIKFRRHCRGVLCNAYEVIPFHLRVPNFFPAKWRALSVLVKCALQPGTTRRLWKYFFGVNWIAFDSELLRQFWAIFLFSCGLFSLLAQTSRSEDAWMHFHISFHPLDHRMHIQNLMKSSTIEEKNSNSLLEKKNH